MQGKKTEIIAPIALFLYKDFREITHAGTNQDMITAGKGQASSVLTFENTPGNISPL